MIFVTNSLGAFQYDSEGDFSHVHAEVSVPSQSGYAFIGGGWSFVGAEDWPITVVHNGPIVGENNPWIWRFEFHAPGDRSASGVTGEVHAFAVPVSDVAAGTGYTGL